MTGRLKSKRSLGRNGVRVCAGCHDKAPQPGGLKQHQFFSHRFGDRKSEVTLRQGRLLRKPSGKLPPASPGSTYLAVSLWCSFCLWCFLACRSITPTSAFIFTCPRVHVCLHMSPFFIGLGPTLLQYDLAINSYICNDSYFQMRSHSQIRRVRSST